MLKYTGGGYGGFIADVPARDLTDEEVDRFGGENALLLTNLYEKPAAARPNPPDSLVGKTLSGDVEEVRKLAKQLSGKEGE